jgi:hypothetical protein
MRMMCVILICQTEETRRSLRGRCPSPSSAARSRCARPVCEIGDEQARRDVRVETRIRAGIEGASASVTACIREQSPNPGGAAALVFATYGRLASTRRVKLGCGALAGVVLAIRENEERRRGARCPRWRNRSTAIKALRCEFTPTLSGGGWVRVG